MTELPEDINERIALWLGWTRRQCHCFAWINPLGQGRIVPDYRNDLNAWSGVHEKFEVDGLWQAWATILFYVLEDSRIPDVGSAHGGPRQTLLEYCFATATPEERCLALWRMGVLGEVKGGGAVMDNSTDWKVLLVVSLCGLYAWIVLHKLEKCLQQVKETLVAMLPPENRDAD